MAWECRAAQNRQGSMYACRRPGCRSRARAHTATTAARAVRPIDHVLAGRARSRRGRRPPGERRRRRGSPRCTSCRRAAPPCSDPVAPEASRRGPPKVSACGVWCARAPVAHSRGVRRRRAHTRACACGCRNRAWAPR
eukprot:scaffold68554_cov52-Phaeocystis_antarctica.AAC.1